MKMFFWNGIDKFGKNQNGTILALSKNHLKDILFEKGVALLGCRKKGESFNLFSFLFKKKVSLEQKAFLFEQLSILIENGLDIIKALAVVTNQIKSKSLKKIILHVVEEVKNGKTFSDCLKKYPKIFNFFIINIIEAGENSGRLSFVLKKISDYLNHKLYLKKKIQQAALVPGITLVLALVIFLGVFIFVVPQFEFFFNSMGKQLPDITKFVIKTSSLLRSSYAMVFIISFLFLLLLIKKIVFSFPRVKRVKDVLLFNVYFLGNIFLFYDLIAFLQVLSMFLVSGIDLQSSLEKSCRIIKNSFFKEKALLLTEYVSRGQSFSGSLQMVGEKYFPQNIISFADVGEQTGKLDVMLAKSATILQEGLDKKLQLFVKAFQPIFMIITGMLIFFLILSVYLPIFSMASSF